jgi:gliding motility-associated-like protein
MGTPHNTIFLTSQLIICDSSVLLNWTTYSGWSTGVSSYEIYASENGLAYTLVATVTGTTSTYLHANLNRGSTYKYIVNAISNGLGYNSISNISTKLIKQPSQPNYAYIQTVTVIDDNEILMRFLPDITANVQLHNVYRSDDNGFTFTQVGTMLPGTPPLLFTDNNVNTQSQSYVYKVVTVDSCGKNAAISNEAKTIFLQAISNSVALSNNLNWNPYAIWDGSVSSYQILRSINNDPTFTVAGSTSSLFSNYEDVDVYDLNYTTGEFCYKIVGLENTNTYGITESSESNTVCVNIDPLVYVPNAFTPGGLNPIFKPIVSYVDYFNYEFEIYNRWGEIIFKTNDVNVGWDGYTSKGKVSKEDVYVYQLRFKTGAGKDVGVQGHVTLLDYEK